MSGKSYRDSLANPVYDVPDQPANPGGVLWKGIGIGCAAMMVVAFLLHPISSFPV